MQRIDISKSQIAAIAAMMRDEFGDDEQLYLDTLEGETNLYEICGRLLAEIEEDEGNVAALKEQAEARKLRRDAAEHRNDVRRQALAALMECARLEKLVLPEATLSIRRVPPKPVVSDEAAIPDDLCRFKQAPDIAAIKAEMEAGHAVSGVTLDNGGVTLSIRRK